MTTNVAEIRKAAICIYIAVEETVAKDIARILNGAADMIEQLQLDLAKTNRSNPNDKS